MKTVLLGFCIFGATAAFGQATGAISNEPVPIRINSHEKHATQMALENEKSLLISSGPVSARGQRPLWELMPPSEEVSLGQAARLLRKQHADDKKSKVYVHD